MPHFKRRPMTFRARHVAAIAFASLLGREECVAQGQPVMIPAVVAQAMSLYFGGGMFGAPSYSSGAPPAGWPKELIPANARIIGGGMLGSGGMLGNSDLFHIRTLVVEMPSGSQPTRAIDAMAADAGYATRSAAELASQGGFIESAGVKGNDPLCKGKTSLLSYTIVDSVASPRIFALNYIDGEVAAQNCDAAERIRASTQVSRSQFGPRGMPALVAPSGVAATRGGVSWSGSSGTMASELLTTMPPDSLVAHYTRQLVAAGWKLDGAALANTIIGAQKFRFVDGDEKWSGLLLVEVVGNRRDVTLRLATLSGEP